MQQLERLGHFRGGVVVGLLQEEVADRFYARLKQRTEEIVVGNPLEPDTRLGPLVNESQYNKVLGFIQVQLCLVCCLYMRINFSQPN